MRVCSINALSLRALPVYLRKSSAFPQLSARIAASPPRRQSRNLFTPDGKAELFRK